MTNKTVMVPVELLEQARNTIQDFSAQPECCNQPIYYECCGSPVAAWPAEAVKVMQLLDSAIESASSSVGR